MPPIDNQINVSYQQAQQMLQSGEAEFASPEAKQKFLTIVSSANQLWNAQGRPDNFNPRLSIPAPTNPGDLGLLNDKWSGNSTSAVFDLTKVMTLLHECAKELKQANKEHRHASRDAEQSNLRAGAAKLRSMAGWTLASGIVSNGMQIAGGASTVIGAGRASTKALKGNQAGRRLGGEMKQQRAGIQKAGKEIKAEQKAFKQQSKALGKELKKADAKTGPQGDKVTEMKQQLQQTKTKLDQARAKQQSMKDKLEATEAEYAEVTRPVQGQADRCMQRWQAGGQMLIGGGGLAAAPMDFMAKNLEADKAVEDAEAAIHRNITQDADERVKDAQEFERNCREKLSSIEEANNRAMSSANSV